MARKPFRFSFAYPQRRASQGYNRLGRFTLGVWVLITWGALPISTCFAQLTEDEISARYLEGTRRLSRRWGECQGEISEKYFVPFFDSEISQMGSDYHGLPEEEKGTAELLVGQNFNQLLYGNPYQRCVGPIPQGKNEIEGQTKNTFISDYVKRYRNSYKVGRDTKGFVTDLKSYLRDKNKTILGLLDQVDKNDPTLLKQIQHYNDYAKSYNELCNEVFKESLKEQENFRDNAQSKEPKFLLRLTEISADKTKTDTDSVLQRDREMRRFLYLQKVLEKLQTTPSSEIKKKNLGRLNTQSQNYDNSIALESLEPGKDNSANFLGNVVGFVSRKLHRLSHPGVDYRIFKKPGQMSGLGTSSFTECIAPLRFDTSLPETEKPPALAVYKNSAHFMRFLKDAKDKIAHSILISKSKFEDEKQYVEYLEASAGINPNSVNQFMLSGYKDPKIRSRDYLQKIDERVRQLCLVMDKSIGEGIKSPSWKVFRAALGFMKSIGEGVASLHGYGRIAVGSYEVLSALHTYEEEVKRNFARSSAVKENAFVVDGPWAQDNAIIGSQELRDAHERKSLAGEKLVSDLAFTAGALYGFSKVPLSIRQSLLAGSVKLPKMWYSNSKSWWQMSKSRKALSLLVNKNPNGGILFRKEARKMFLKDYKSFKNLAGLGFRASWDVPGTTLYHLVGWDLNILADIGIYGFGIPYSIGVLSGKNANANLDWYYEKQSYLSPFLYLIQKKAHERELEKKSEKEPNLDDETSDLDDNLSETPQTKSIWD